MKLTLIIDKAEAYLQLQKKQVLSSWGVEASQVEQVQKLEEAPGTSLFGGQPTILGILSSPDEVKQWLAALEPHSASTLEEKVPGGLLLLTSVPRTSTKKLEAKVTALGGAVRAQASGKGVNPARDLVKGLGLSKTCSDFLVDYAGENYETLVPLVSSLEDNIPLKLRASITVEQLEYRMAQAAGGRPAYELLQPLVSGNTVLLQEKYARIITHNPPLMILSMTRNKFQSLYRQAVLQSAGASTPASAAKLLGEASSYKQEQDFKNAKQIGLTKLTTIVGMIHSTENALKGGSAAPTEPLLNALLVEISELVKSGR